MNDMYDRLGDLLNSAIENNELPEISPVKKDEEVKNEKRSNIYQKEIAENQVNHVKNRKITLNFIKKTLRKQNNKKNGKIMHKNCINIQFPIKIQNALTTLDIAYPVTIHKIKRQYRLKLKQIHPDKNINKIPEITIQTSENVYKTIQLTIDIIQDSYNLLIKYFTV